MLPGSPPRRRGPHAATRGDLLSTDTASEPTRTTNTTAPDGETAGLVGAAHARPAEEVLEKLEVDPREGLSGRDAEQRLEEHGENKLPEGKKDSPIVRYFRHFHDVLIYVLLAAAALTAVMQHWVDTIVILLVVVINATIGFVQEGKAEKALEGIRDMLSPSASVRRGGSWSTVDAEGIVPGDIVRLSAGDKVPADLRLLQASDLAAEESALTGESVPAEKTSDPVEEDAGIGDRFSMLYSGTMITSGTATGVVTGTGANTELGRISTMMSEVETLETPLSRQIARFSLWLSGIVLVMSVVLVLIGWLAHGWDWSELLLSAVGFAVAAIPEGLPALITITLALGVQTMAGKNAITRKLPAVQTLGAVTTICSDKTGTLTKNEMTVEHAVLAAGELDVSGAGYDPEGEVTRDGETLGLDDVPGLRRLVEALSLANDTDLVRGDDDQWTIVGEPTEGALQSFARKLDYQADQDARRATLPFSSENKLMATTADLGDEGTLVLVKGAPDRLLDRASHQLDAHGEQVDLDRETWERHVDELSDRGLRVLAAATREATDTDRDSLTIDSLGEDLTLLGIVGIVDPPRPEAIEAVRVCREAGITVTMITGDHAGTATAIARQMGIDDGEGALTGADLEGASDEELEDLVQKHHVFARTSPEHKLRLVKALQARGEVVAMTGDGVNDAPALRRADVGVAMGIKGTEVTKESAEVVLADDNFTTIETAVEEGRRIYDNLRKAIVFLLPTNGAQSAVILVAVLAGWTLPLTPLQVLWVNMVTSITLAFAFAFEPAEKGIMQRAPEKAGSSIVGWRHVVQIAVVSALIAGVTIAAFRIVVDQGMPMEAARSLATTTLVICQVFFLFNVKALESSSLRPAVWLNNRAAWLVVGILTLLQLAFIYAPPLQALFNTAPLGIGAIAVMTLVGIGVFLATELVKLALYGRGGRQRVDAD
ncbi:MAG: HAD-IC family P-type ATPase [Brachybacterium sp.]|nr:HAD-IC family P-type ATPase [Brachybacterium sp.]